MIELAKIRTDGGTQSRAQIHEETVAEYAEAMADPDTVFPPCIVYYDGKSYWLADGFHRVAAWKRAGRVEVPADVRQGDRRRAILHSVAANSTHGLRRSNADKRRAVMTLLEDDEWSAWSNREIARRCGVSDMFVGKLRSDASANGLQIADTRTVERGGTTYTQDTSSIGKARAVEPPDAEEQEQPAAPADVPDLKPDAVANREDQTEEPPAPDPHAKVRREFRSMTKDGQEEDWIGLRLENADLRKRVSSQRGEIADLKAKVKELTSDEDAGRKIGNLQRRLSQAEGRSKEHQASAARLQRQVNAQKAEIDNLRKQLEGQEIPL